MDTLADIRLNGTHLGRAENMHRVWEYDVKGLLRPENTVEVHFESPMRAAHEAAAKYPLWGVTHTTVDGYQHIRKSHCMYGWDWGPQLPDMGLFRPVQLVTYHDAEIRDVWVRQKHENGRVKLTVSAETDFAGEVLPAEVTVYAPDGTTADFSDTLDRKLVIDSPELWWPNGWGAQPLYTVTVRIRKDGAVCAEKSVRIGLRIP